MLFEMGVGGDDYTKVILVQNSFNGRIVHFVAVYDGFTFFCNGTN